MTGFYDLPSSEQLTALRDLLLDALDAWDLGRIEQVEVLAERENAVYAVVTDQGRFVARVHRAGYHTDGQLRSQVEWMRALQSAGVVRTADAVDTRAGDVFTVAARAPVPEPRQVSVLEWVEGERLSDRLASAPRGEVEEWYERIGELVAGLHEHAISWDRPPGFSCFSWDIEGLLGDDAVWGRFWALDGMAPEDRAVLVSFREHAVEALQGLSREPGRYGLVHNDFLAENLLVHAGEITLLDFDDCGESWFVSDLCPALISVATRDDYPAVRAAFLSGYRARRSLTDEELESLPLFVALRMATYAAWLDTRRHTQFAKDLGPVIVDAALDVVRRYFAGSLDA